MLGLRSSSLGRNRSIAVFRSSQGDDAPDSWDWRPKGIVNGVKNQAKCGSCWTFSAVAAMEGAFNLNSKGKVPSACAGTTCGPDDTPCCSFSEQELLDCVEEGSRTCKTGGDPAEGIEEIAKNMTGFAYTEKAYPYISGDGDSPGVCKAKTHSGVDTGITGFTSVHAGDEAALKEAVHKQSIISIGIDASQSSFQFYHKGVYMEPKCSSSELDHGVAIVGYGVESGPSPAPPSPGPSPGPAPGPSPGPSPAPGPWDCINNKAKAGCESENGCHWCTSIGGWCSNTPCLGTQQLQQQQQNLQQQQQEGTPYWIVRNSWGPSWGQDGYIKMARNRENQCGVASDANFANVGSRASLDILV